MHPDYDMMIWLDIIIIMPLAKVCLFASSQMEMEKEFTSILKVARFIIL